MTCSYLPYLKGVLEELAHKYRNEERQANNNPEPEQQQDHQTNISIPSTRKSYNSKYTSPIIHKLDIVMKKSIYGYYVSISYILLL